MRLKAVSAEPLGIRRIYSAMLTAFLAVLLLQSCLWARPTTAEEAALAVTGWLRFNARPLGMALGGRVINVETFTDRNANPAYYAVYLEGGGFVIVAADDLVEPIITFADEGVFEPATGNPLAALVRRDVERRVAAARNTISLQTGSTVMAKGKWRHFTELARYAENSIALLGETSISDVRVEPFIQSKWGQTTCCDRNCYNYYTPRNYPSGCTATAMAQLMRYHEYPDGRGSIGSRRFRIKVDDILQDAYTRGGDGGGGPYQWSLMALEPDCESTLEQREAIGALCYDAGVAARSEYAEHSTSSSLRNARSALLGTFMYSNAVRALKDDINKGRDALNNMVNPNLDAGYPAILGIVQDDTEVGHAVIVDGYGYDLSTLYHHLNMGWKGNHDVWYNLPDVDYSEQDYYDVINGCIYNIFTYGSGEIISGRVTDLAGNPVSGATVIARGWGGPYTAETNDKGIYALVKVDAHSTYTISAVKVGYEFTDRQVTTGKSGESDNSSGNSWGVDFVGEDVSADASYNSREDFETGGFDKFPWLHSGDNRWEVTFVEPYAGTYGAAAGQINDNERATLQVSVECVSGDISFYRRVSSEAGCDYLRFYIDGTEAAKWSGTEEWDPATFEVEAGPRTFAWTYSKDSSISRGSDTAWIDEIVFPLASDDTADPDSSGLGGEKSRDDFLTE
jgi:hypothetical protein